MEGFSIIHFNSRSLYTKFGQIKDYLKSLKHTFQVIAISETWLTNEKGADFVLEGYDIFSVNQIDKKGGGVAFFVQKDFQCKVIDSTVVNDIMESLTIEIHSTTFKSIFFSCIYRTPGSCIHQFVNTIVDILGKVCDKKSLFVCGDFNIDLLKWNEHKLTTDFCNAMFTFGLWPLIDKPSRITKESATLIDNIFTNVYEQATSGLFLSDICDHLPIFVILHNLKVKCSVGVSERPCKLVTIRTPQRIEALKMDLTNHNWDEVYVDDPNQGYDAFLFTFLELYNKHCPIKKCWVKDKYKGKPWMTKSLQRACKKK